MTGVPGGLQCRDLATSYTFSFRNTSVELAMIRNAYVIIEQV